jgi:hypothetical protein
MLRIQSQYDFAGLSIFVSYPGNKGTPVLDALHVESAFHIRNLHMRQHPPHSYFKVFD